MTMWIPKRLVMKPTSARYWYTMIIELGSRAAGSIRQENPYGRFPR